MLCMLDHSLFSFRHKLLILLVCPNLEVILHLHDASCLVSSSSIISSLVFGSGQCVDALLAF